MSIASYVQARPESESRQLWSLWDMLEYWGYRYYAVGTALAFAEFSLATYRRDRTGLGSGRGIEIDPSAQEVSFLLDKCQEILKLADERDLSPIPQNVTNLIALVTAVRNGSSTRILFVDDLLQDVLRISNDFRAILVARKFYAVSLQSADLHGNPALFGEAVAKKFPKAQSDIERAGNCLALGEPTACVLHLSRAMEIATHRLARKLHITPDAKDSWGAVLGKMTQPIKDMKDSAEKDKRKKEKWSECRTNLYYVKMAWRDPGAHGKQSYDEKEAHDILGRVRSFMQQLATLL